MSLALSPLISRWWGERMMRHSNGVEEPGGAVLSPFQISHLVALKVLSFCLVYVLPPHIPRGLSWAVCHVKWHTRTKHLSTPDGNRPRCPLPYAQRWWRVRWSVCNSSLLPVNLAVSSLSLSLTSLNVYRRNDDCKAHFFVLSWVFKDV